MSTTNTIRGDILTQEEEIYDRKLTLATYLKDGKSFVNKDDILVFSKSYEIG